MLRRAATQNSGGPAPGRRFTASYVGMAFVGISRARGSFLAHFFCRPVRAPFGARRRFPLANARKKRRQKAGERMPARRPKGSVSTRSRTAQRAALVEVAGPPGPRAAVDNEVVAATVDREVFTEVQSCTSEPTSGTVFPAGRTVFPVPGLPATSGAGLSALGPVPTRSRP